MIETIKTVAFWMYVCSMLIGAAFTTSELDEIRGTIRSGDRNFVHYPLWYREFQVLLIASIFTFIPFVNSFTAIAGVFKLMTKLSD